MCWDNKTSRMELNVLIIGGEHFFLDFNILIKRILNGYDFGYCFSYNGLQFDLLLRLRWCYIELNIVEFVFKSFLIGEIDTYERGSRFETE